jgi:hypothetical protein
MNLIERLEDAIEGDAELDEGIAEFLGHEVTEYRGGIVAGWGRRVINYKHGWLKGDKEPLPHYTTSIDAALTLVPEEIINYGIELYIGAKENGCDFPAGQYDNWVQVRGAATPALALCIAALKARDG